MDEIENVKKLWSDQNGASRQWMTRTRNQLTDEARGAGSGGSGERARVPRPRFGRVAAAAGVSTALAAGVVVSQTLSLGSGPAPATASADTVLQEAADTAAAGAPADRGEFAYLKTKRTVRGSADRAVSTRMQWLSVDDSAAGLIRSRMVGQALPRQAAGSRCSSAESGAGECKVRVEAGEQAAINATDGDWRERPVEAGTQSDDNLLHDPTYAYLRALPEDPARLADMLRSELSAVDESIGVLHGVGMIMSEQVVPPRTASALFEAIQRFDGVAVDDDVTIAASGESGVAVTRTSNGVRTALVFDSQSYDFLGVQRTEGGKVQSSTGVLAGGLVNETGQRP